MIDINQEIERRFFCRNNNIWMVTLEYLFTDDEGWRHYDDYGMTIVTTLN